MRAAYLLPALMLFLSLRVAAQGDEPLFHRISLEQGLSDARVSAIVQDKYGYMWFGTANGLNRYDGYNIKVYTEGESGLHNNTITTLFCSRAGTLYAGDGDGLLEYNYTTDRFARPKGTDSSNLNKKGFYVSLMAEDAAGFIYVGCTEGFFRYNPQKASIEDLNKVLNTSGKIRRISGLTFGKDGRLWVTTQKEGFFVINPATNTWSEIPHDRQYGHDSCCYAIHRTLFLDDDHLLLGQHSYGFTILDTRTMTFNAQQGMMGKNDSVRFNAIYRLIKDYKGRIWGGTAYFGLIQYLPQTKGIIQYKNDPFNPYSYGGYRVFALYEDREHNIWVGTGGYGIYRFHPDKGGIRYFPWNPIGASSPPGPEVLSAAVRDSSSAWIGTDMGPGIFNARNGTFKAFRYVNAYSASLPGTNINYVYPDKRGKVWFASRFLGITRFDESSQQFVRFHKNEENLIRRQAPPLRQPLPGDYINTVAEDPWGDLLLLISRRITLFDPQTGNSRYGTTDSSEELLRLKDVDDIISQGDRLIIAIQSKKGSRVLSYSFATKTSTTLAVLDSAGKMHINSLQIMPDGNVAAATSEGIFTIRSVGGILGHYTWNADATHNNILGIVTGLPGVIWACTDRHIGRLDLRKNAWQWLGSSEGLKPTRFFGDAFRLLPDGHIVAGCGDGLFLINPAGLSNSTTQAPVLVDFKVSGKTLTLPAPLQDIREISLSHEQNFFSFGMSTLHFGESSNTEYSYKLEGFDRDWQPAGSDRIGQYTGVRGGSYTLLLRARSGTAAWVESPNKVRIIIAKPWWGTWTFRIGLLLVLIGIVAGIYFYRVKGIRKEARLRSEYEIRLNELEMSALRTQMNPHFIFNCLNTINSYINSNQKTQANHYITRFAKLIRLILENSRQRRVPLSKELEALQLYLQLEALRFENRFTWSVDVDEALDVDNIEVPPLVLQPFVENAILHGILPRPGSGNISVRIFPKGKLIEYIVEDDGIGRKEAKKRSAEGALQKESHGMAITEKRIELFNREHEIEAAVIVDDLEKDGVATGTRVTIPLALVEGF